MRQLAIVIRWRISLRWRPSADENCRTLFCPRWGLGEACHAATRTGRPRLNNSGWSNLMCEPLFLTVFCISGFGKGPCHGNRE